MSSFCYLSDSCSLISSVPLRANLQTLLEKMLRSLFGFDAVVGQTIKTPSLFMNYSALILFHQYYLETQKTRSAESFSQYWRLLDKIRKKIVIVIQTKITLKNKDNSQESDKTHFTSRCCRWVMPKMKPRKSQNNQLRQHETWIELI